MAREEILRRERRRHIGKRQHLHIHSGIAVERAFSRYSCAVATGCRVSTSYTLIVSTPFAKEVANCRSDEDAGPFTTEPDVENIDP